MIWVMYAYGLFCFIVGMIVMWTFNKIDKL